MSDQMKSSGRKAASYFAQAEQRDKLVRAQIEKERAESLAKTAKLRALRLAKEAGGKEVPSAANETRSPAKPDSRPRKRIIRY